MWTKGYISPTRTDTVLVTMKLQENIWTKNGQGYEEHLYDMEANFSLVIENVTTGYEGLYACSTIDPTSGYPISNGTALKVFGK